jgi:hypothetical protein
MMVNNNNNNINNNNNSLCFTYVVVYDAIFNKDEIHITTTLIYSITFRLFLLRCASATLAATNEDVIIRIMQAYARTQSITCGRTSSPSSSS